jgi:hypothetical protein
VPGWIVLDWLRWVQVYFSEEEPGQDSFAAGCSIKVHSVAALKCMVNNMGFMMGLNLSYADVLPQTGHAHVWANMGHFMI